MNFYEVICHQNCTIVCLTSYYSFGTSDHLFVPFLVVLSVTICQEIASFGCVTLCHSSIGTSGHSWYQSVMPLVPFMVTNTYDTLYSYFSMSWHYFLCPRFMHLL